MRQSSLAMITALIVSTLCGCGKSSPTMRRGGQGADGQPDSHERMLQTLDQIKGRVAFQNPYLGNAELRWLRDELSTLSPQATTRRADLTFQIGTKNVYLGNIKQGIREQEAAVDMLLRDSVPESALNDLFFKLGVAYLRLGETENCVEAHTSESCLFPIRGGGVHVHKQGATKAFEYFSSVLSRRPDHLPSRWLLNVAAMTLGRYPDDVPAAYLIPPEVFESEEPFPRFVDSAAGLGLDTFSLAGGSIVDDFDDDGFLDIVVSSWDPAGQIRYFHNDGDGSYSDATDAAGLRGIYGGLNLVHADYDNDSDVDVLVLRGGWLAESGRHPNSLLRNDGDGHFRDVTFDAGLGDVHYPTQTASWGDYDNDGDLDLSIGNEGFPNQLFQNQGDGTFVDVATTAGVDDKGFAKGVIWGDYDNDRLCDLYVSNLDGPNRLYHNNGNGTFSDLAVKLGVTRPNVSFPVWFWDFDNDGVLDIFVASFYQDVALVAADYLGIPHQSEMDCLYQGDGKGGFREVAAEQNLKRVTQPMGSNFGDLDNDGFLDFYLGTGYPEYEGLVPNLMFRNNKGSGFLDVTAAGGFGHLQKGHGVSFADLDNDGDQDIFEQLGGWVAGDAYGDVLFENPGFGNHSITIKLVGTESNASAIGARIRIDIEEQSVKRSIYRWVNGGGSFGGNPLRQQIGVGTAEKIERLEVYWPTTDQTQIFHDLSVDQFIEIVEGEQEYRQLPWELAKFSASKTTHSRHDHAGHDHAGHGHHDVGHDDDATSDHDSGIAK